jgi:PAS domain-containing protein
MVDAARHNRTVLVNNLADYPAFQQAESAGDLEDYARVFGKHIAAPVVASGQVLGALFIGRGVDRDDLSERDAQLVETLATQVGLALENRRLFQQAQAEQRNLRSILETLPAGVLVLDPNTLLPIQFNEQAQNYLGHEIAPDIPFSVEAYHLYRTGTDLHYPMEELPIFAALRAGQEQAADDVAVVIDDMQIDLLVNAAPITDSAGNTTAIVAAFQDISNLRSLETRCRRTWRDGSSHEAQRQLMRPSSRRCSTW